MVAPMIVHARLCKAAARVDVAVDAPAGPLVPADIECSKFREELQLAVGKIVMDPPRHCAPVHAPHGDQQTTAPPPSPSRLCSPRNRADPRYGAHSSARSMRSSTLSYSPGHSPPTRGRRSG